MLIVSGVPVIVTFLSEQPSSTFAILIMAPENCLQEGTVAVRHGYIVPDSRMLVACWVIYTLATMSHLFNLAESSFGISCGFGCHFVSLKSHAICPYVSGLLK